MEGVESMFLGREFQRRFCLVSTCFTKVSVGWLSRAYDFITLYLWTPSVSLNCDVGSFTVNEYNWINTTMIILGNRVARIDGPRYSELEALLNQYQFLNSDLDLFSESAQNSNNFTPHPSPWGNGAASSSDFARTPRTTAAFIPGYDWNRKGGFFDEVAKDLEKKSGFDFEKSYEDDWMPKIDDWNS